MSVHDELHDLVDRLDDDHAAEALMYLRGLLTEDGAAGDTAEARLTRRMAPRALAGRAFLAQQRTPDLATLAAQQGVSPVTNFDDLLGDFWPEDETADEFIAAVRQWRRDGGYA